MGTNYRLVYPVDNCSTCGLDKNRTREDIHIGKSSAGWVFLWHGYEEPIRSSRYSYIEFNLRNSTEWAAFLYIEYILSGARIITEYEESVTPEDFIRMVLRKRESEVSQMRIVPDQKVTPEGDDISFRDFS